MRTMNNSVFGHFLRSEICDRMLAWSLPRKESVIILIVQYFWLKGVNFEVIVVRWLDFIEI